MERVRLKAKRDNTLVSKATECTFCGRSYLEPCNEARSKTCSNTKLTKAAKAKRASK